MSPVKHIYKMAKNIIIAKDKTEWWEMMTAGWNDYMRGIHPDNGMSLNDWVSQFQTTLGWTIEKGPLGVSITKNPQS